jgi:hypothetical protein
MATKSKKPAIVAAVVADIPEAAPAPSLYPAALSLESLAGIGCANLAAVTKANLALSQGMQEIGQEMLRCAQSALASAGQTATALFSFEAVMQRNADLASAGLDAMLGRSSRLSALGANFYGAAFAPLESFVRQAKSTAPA